MVPMLSLSATVERGISAPALGWIGITGVNMGSGFNGSGAFAGLLVVLEVSIVVKSGGMQV
jgi:hypothetical protein